jgi:hypothetical protein
MKCVAFVGNKTRIVQRALKVKYMSLLPEYTKWLSWGCNPTCVVYVQGIGKERVIFATKWVNNQWNSDVELACAKCYGQNLSHICKFSFFNPLFFSLKLPVFLLQFFILRSINVSCKINGLTFRYSLYFRLGVLRKKRESFLSPILDPICFLDWYQLRVVSTPSY